MEEVAFLPTSTLMEINSAGNPSTPWVDTDRESKDSFVKSAT